MKHKIDDFKDNIEDTVINKFYIFNVLIFVPFLVILLLDRH